METIEQRFFEGGFFKSDENRIQFNYNTVVFNYKVFDIKFEPSGLIFNKRCLKVVNNGLELWEGNLINFIGIRNFNIIGETGLQEIVINNHHENKLYKYIENGYYLSIKYEYYLRWKYKNPKKEKFDKYHIFHDSDEKGLITKMRNELISDNLIIE